MSGIRGEVEEQPASSNAGEDVSILMFCESAVDGTHIAALLLSR